MIEKWGEVMGWQVFLGGGTLSIEDVEFSNSELLKSTSSASLLAVRNLLVWASLVQASLLQWCRRKFKGSFTKLVLSPIPEIQIDNGKSDNRMVFLDGLSLQASTESRTTRVTEMASLKMSSLYRTHILPL